jgi:hypothetical protein
MLRIRVILIFIHPGSWFSDPGSQIPCLGSKKNNKRGGKKKKILSYLFCSQKCHKIGNYLIFEQVQKKCQTIDKELYYFLQE